MLTTQRFLLESSCFYMDPTYTETKTACLTALISASFCKTSKTYNIKDHLRTRQQGNSDEIPPIWKCTPYAVTNFSRLHWALCSTEGYFIETSPSHFCLGINLLPGYGSCLIWQQRKQNTETSNITSTCEVSNLSIISDCWKHSGECFIISKQPLPGH